MRELEREPPSDIPACTRLAIVGGGRLGSALTRALADTGFDVTGPWGRGADGVDAEAVLLCVPDAEIARAAALISPGRLVGHCSGASGLAVLAPHEAFSLHPLMTVTQGGAEFSGAGAAIAGSTPRALELTGALATRLGMQPVQVAERDRALYHAAASVASNFLITVEAAAERLMGEAGVSRALLVPLVRATVENWASVGAERALTGPVARGDEQTVEAQRRAIGERQPELLDLFDALVTATRRLSHPGHTGRKALTSAARRAGMRTIRTVAELRGALQAPRREGLQIGLVPTMGAFHDGHLSLIRQARAQCDLVVVSLFINPAQFNDRGDLDAYPRDEARDAAQAAELGVDFLFAPPVQEVYPAGFATTVSVAGLTETLEGEHRGRGHFDGVATVVTKLFNMVGPDVAYFGQKDAQQALVIKRLVEDLNLPVRIEVCATVREADGLAMSSRNVHLSPDERVRAAALRRALLAAEQAATAGDQDPRTVRARALTELRAVEIEPEYLKLVSAVSLAPVQRIEGELLAVVAAQVGTTRLIDNHPFIAGTAVSTNHNGRP